MSQDSPDFIIQDTKATKYYHIMYILSILWLFTPLQTGETRKLLSKST
jgi:hypothetical protein